MAKSKLNLEDSLNEEFNLLAIHTDLIDYRLAYFLNKKLGLNLSRKTFDLNFVNSKASFSVFEYINEENLLKWNLISNIYNHNFTEKSEKKVLDDFIHKFDMKPGSIIERLNLTEVNYKEDTLFSHFGHKNRNWEKIENF